ncbi:MAG TPA: hypothetical protein VK952_06995 [Methylotenera sp.]|nr:hypothetical protein [Methylotenera sp.]
MKPLPREWLKYEYLDPEKILIGLKEIAESYPLHELRYPSRTLRTHELRKYGEGRQAALFCYGMGIRLGTKVSFALVERQDYDAVAVYELNGIKNFVPVQLKEWTPESLPSPNTLQEELNKLKKYADALDLAVVFHLNRESTVKLSELSVPQNIGELWFVGCTEPSQKHWTLIGDMLKKPVANDFTYPTL